MARIVIREEDNSVSASALAGMYAGIVLVADKGKADRLTNIDSETALINNFGKPIPKKSITHYSAMCFLAKSSNLMAIRAIHEATNPHAETDNDRTARFAAALVRGNVAPIPAGIPEASYVPDRAVEPFISNDGYGLRQQDINSFAFPQYAREREYKALKNKVAFASDGNVIALNITTDLKPGNQIALETITDDNKETATLFTINDIRVEDVSYQKVVFNKPVTAQRGERLRRVFVTESTANYTATGPYNAGATSLTLSSVAGISSGTTLKIGDNFYVVQSVDLGTLTVELRTPLGNAVTDGQEVIIMTRSYSDTDVSAKVLRPVDGSTDVLFEDADNLINGATYTFQTTGITNAESEFLLVQKELYTETQNQLLLDKEVSVTSATPVVKLIKSNFEQRDVLLVYADNQGEWGNKIAVEILPSNDYPTQCRVINVYDDGVKVESFEVSFEDMVDGLGVQMFVEDKINDISSYIRVKHNPAMVEEDGTPILPALTSYSLWREAPSDIFVPNGITLIEDVLLDDTDIIVSDSTALTMGNRIKLGKDSAEYKITGKSTKTLQDGTAEHHITIDRPVLESTIRSGTQLYIFSGVELKPLGQLDSMYPAYGLNSQLTISGKLGHLLDCGSNQLRGGHNGSAPDVGDMIRALNLAFASREEVTVNMILTGGVWSPIYAQAVSLLCTNRENTFGYLSGDPTALDNSDPIAALEKFRANLALDCSYTGVFPDYLKYYDVYNKKSVWIAVDGIAAACQSAASEGKTWGEVAAGWQSGKLFSVNGLRRIWSEAQRERLLNIQMNPVKFHKTRGYSIWGNKTNFVTRSYLQMRNVRFILLQLNQMVREYMEAKHWTITDESKRAVMAIELSDAVAAFSDVLNGWSVFDTTTTQDEDAGILRMYVGIQPKGVVDDINLTFGIFSNSKSIEVS